MPALVTESTLREAFQGKVARGTLNPVYRLGLLVVAVAIVLLPLLYVLLAVLVGCGVLWYAVHGTVVLSGGGGTLYRLIVYIAPLFGGVVLVLFMIKPLFARPVRRRAPLELDPAEQPLLFAFVEHVRRAVGAPAPAAVAVDCNVNASASFRRGLASFVASDLMLTLGTPLLAGLSSRQLAGVLAHEFGHFSQGSGMRLTYLIRSVNLWLARVVHERDSWDEGLRRLSEETDFRIGIVLYVSRFMVWLTRRILWVFMMLGHAISTFMLRQMEFDADRYEVHLAGSEAFASTALRMRVLSASSHMALSLLEDSWFEKRLCDDFAGLVVAVSDQMSPETLEAVQSAPQRASLFDTHPPDSARIERARQKAAQGILRLEEPAASLVDDLVGLSRSATLAFYRELGLEPVPANVVGLTDFVAWRKQVSGEMRGSSTYFHDVFGLLRPLSLPLAPPDPVESEESGLEALRKAIEAVHRLLPAAREALTDRKSSAPPPNTSIQAIEALRDATRDRFLAALALQATPSVRPRLSDAEDLSRELQCFYPFATTVAELAMPLNQMLEAHRRTMTLIQHLDQDRSLQPQAIEALAKLQAEMRRIAKRLDDLPYPFEHAQGAVSVSQVTGAGEPPPALDWNALPHCVSVATRLSGIYDRCLGRLAAVAERIERELGLSSPAPATDAHASNAELPPPA